ncbi:MAG: hypothetical protein QOJ42_1793, partial [Acidobacteriaceae bacterium]|nr:hypothetical protein [Acidobacteriaceae bacterium]
MKPAGTPTLFVMDGDGWFAHPGDERSCRTSWHFLFCHV